jgi:hypothetical protein
MLWRRCNGLHLLSFDCSDPGGIIISSLDHPCNVYETLIVDLHLGRNFVIVFELIELFVGFGSLKSLKGLFK